MRSRGQACALCFWNTFGIQTSELLLENVKLALSVLALGSLDSQPCCRIRLPPSLGLSREACTLSRWGRVKMKTRGYTLLSQAWFSAGACRCKTSLINKDFICCSPTFGFLAGLHLKILLSTNQILISNQLTYRNVLA